MADGMTADVSSNVTTVAGKSVGAKRGGMNRHAAAVIPCREFLELPSVRRRQCGMAKEQSAVMANEAVGFGAAAFRDYRRELHRYLLRRLRRPQDVDDLAQEVYLRLLRHDESKCVHKPLAYLYGIASHVVADYRTDMKQDQRHLTFDSDDEESWSQAPASVLPDQLADRLNLQQQLERALSQLPSTHAAVLLAHKRDGLSYEEVAAKLNLSVHTVEKYVTQAKARIRLMSWER
jgi:RNA polymerase sigma-70 factor (ECF subfamily)